MVSRETQKYSQHYKTPIVVHIHQTHNKSKNNHHTHVSRETL